MFPAAAQKREVEAANVGRLYEKSDGYSVQDVIAGIRRGETLVIAGLYALGSDREEIQKALASFAAKNITVERARDGRKADAGTAAWIIEDFRAIAGERRLKSRKNASRQGAKGGRPPLEKPMTDTAMLRIWRKRGKSTKERADLIGLPVRQVYRWLDEIEARQNPETD